MSLLTRPGVPRDEQLEAMARRSDRAAEEITRVNARVPVALAARIDEARARLRREGLLVSASALVEVALGELLDRRDLPAVLRRYGAKARRD